MTNREYHPLNYGELMNLADLYVETDKIPKFPLSEACDSFGLLPIYDAEMELVCLVPADKADLMVRLINTYKWHNEHEPQ